MTESELEEALVALGHELRRRVAAAPATYVAPAMQRRAEEMIRSAVLVLAARGGDDVRAIPTEAQRAEGSTIRPMLPADLLVTVELSLRGISGR